MKRRSIIWDLNKDDFEVDVITLCEKARTYLDKLDGAGTVHGDLHADNILLWDSIPYLIDYANCGRGHPCFDLVRFYSDLLFTNFRLVITENELADFFKTVFLTEPSFDEIAVPES